MLITNISNLMGCRFHWNDIFDDSRGSIFTYLTKSPIEFVEHKVSISKKHVLRGYHGDNVTDKLITCIDGQVLVSLIDARLISRTAGICGANTLYQGMSIFVPKGILCCMYFLDKTIINYSLTHPYAGPEAQVTVSYKDPDIVQVFQAYKEPILSKRDIEDVVPFSTVMF